jgi:hypothetical protein
MVQPVPGRGEAEGIKDEAEIYRGPASWFGRVKSFLGGTGGDRSSEWGLGDNGGREPEFGVGAGDNGGREPEFGVGAGDNDGGGTGSACLVDITPAGSPILSSRGRSQLGVAINYAPAAWKLPDATARLHHFRHHR